MTTNDWWNAPCEPMGGCQTAFIRGDGNLVVWPVWRNPNDPEYFTIKVHNIATEKWTKLSGHFCTNHTNLLIQDWEVSTQADVDWMERTDAWAIKNGGKQ